MSIFPETDLHTSTTIAAYQGLQAAFEKAQASPELLNTETADGYPLYIRPQMNAPHLSESMVEFSITVGQDWTGEQARRKLTWHFDVLAEEGVVLMHGGVVIPGFISGPSAAAADLARAVLSCDPALQGLQVVESVRMLALFPGHRVIHFSTVRTVSQVRTYLSEDDEKVLTEMSLVGGGGVVMDANYQVYRIIE